MHIIEAVDLTVLSNPALSSPFLSVHHRIPKVNTPAGSTYRVIRALRTILSYLSFFMTLELYENSFDKDLAGETYADDTVAHFIGRTHMNTVV